jgi:catechol 2,3-dioxygenase-like lactoylglutathione lyase family enzyme
MPSSPALRLDHAVVPVHDAAAARAFYGDVLGLPLVTAMRGGAWGGRAWLMMVFGLGEGGQHVVATAFAGVDRFPVNPYPRDARHVAFAVASALEWESWKARLDAAKVDHWQEDHGDQRSLYVVDPSGNVLEITTPASVLPAQGAPPSADAVVDEWLAVDGHRRGAQRICLDFHERRARTAVVVIGDEATGPALVEALRVRWKQLVSAMSAGIAHADGDQDTTESNARLHAMEGVVIPTLGQAPAGAAYIRVSLDPSDLADAEVVYASASLGDAPRAAIEERHAQVVTF